MESLVIGICVFFALVSAGLVWIEGDDIARRERIARAVRPRHGGPIVPPAPARNRLGED